MTTVDLTQVSERFWTAAEKPWRIHTLTALRAPWAEARLVWRVPAVVSTAGGPRDDLGIPPVWEGRLSASEARDGQVQVLHLRLRTPNYLRSGGEWLDGALTLVVGPDGRCLRDRAWVDVVARPGLADDQLALLAKNFHTGALPALLALDALNRGAAHLEAQRLVLTGDLP